MKNSIEKKKMQESEKQRERKKWCTEARNLEKERKYKVSKWMTKKGVSESGPIL